MKRLVLCLLAFGFLHSCSSDPARDEAAIRRDAHEQESLAAYEKVLNKYSEGDIEYNGLYNRFGLHATLLNSRMIEAFLQREADFYLWDNTRLDEEKDKAFKKAAESTEVFLSFFTPDRHDDNLATEKTIWRVLLDVGNKRYVGKVKKSKRILSELIAFYPFHSRWNTGYVISFPVAVSQAEAQNSTLILTGPLGSRSLSFPARE